MAGENEKAAKTVRPGFDADGKAYPGVDEKTGERVSVTLEGLQKELGPKKGEEAYLRIAGLDGGKHFFNPNSEATNFRPPLGLAGLDADTRKQVDAILSGKE